MNTTIDLPTSVMQIRHRVIAKRRSDGGEIILFTSIQYLHAEEFCWRYNGGYELRIEKVWVPK